MRILFLTKRFYPEIGGVEKHVLEISRELISRGHELTIISEQGHGKFRQNPTNYHSDNASARTGKIAKSVVKSIQSESDVVSKIKLVRIEVGRDDWFKKFRIWGEIFRNFKQIYQADVIHCHDVFFWFLPFRFLFFYKRVYTTFHGYESYPIKLKAILIRKISEVLSDGTICVGDFMKKWYYANPDYIIYGGVRQIREKHAKYTKSALFFGRLDPQTGINAYVNGARIIKEKLPNFRLIVYGDGPLSKNTGIKTSKLNSNITKIIPDYELIFVSRYLSILEALIAKRPVFAVFDNPVKQDYLEMSPFSKYIKIASNSEELASMVQNYYSNKKTAQKYVQSGFLWAKKQSWENVATTYLKLWSDSTKRNQRGKN